MFALVDRRVREEVWGGGCGGEKLLEVLGGLSVDALVSDEDDLVLYESVPFFYT